MYRGNKGMELDCGVWVQLVRGMFVRKRDEVTGGRRKWVLRDAALIIRAIKSSGVSWAGHVQRTEKFITKIWLQGIEEGDHLDDLETDARTVRK
jgi:hypothetical protein